MEVIYSHICLCYSKSIHLDLVTWFQNGPGYPQTPAEGCLGLRTYGAPRKSRGSEQSPEIYLKMKFSGIRLHYSCLPAPWHAPAKRVWAGCRRPWPAWTPWWCGTLETRWEILSGGEGPREIIRWEVYETTITCTKLTTALWCSNFIAMKCFIPNPDASMITLQPATF